MKLNNLKVSSNSKFKKKNRSMYFKKRNSHLFKSKSNRFHSKFNVNSNEFNYKLPILTCIELVDEQSKLTSTSNESINSTSFSSSLSSVNSCLFNDYLLISSKTKYKYLLCTLFEQVNFDFKDNYTIIDGFLKINNWEPINLNSISSIAQCLNKSDDNLKPICSSSGLTKENTDSQSIYDVLKQVVSFISINIRVKLKSQSGVDNCKILNNVCKTNVQEKSSLSQTIPSTQTFKHEIEETPEHQEETNEEEENEHERDNDEQESPGFSHNQFQNNFNINNLNQKIPNISPNLSALLYTNPQLASLFPMFNLPILSQYLNGFKKPESQIDYSNFIQNKFNPSPKNSSLSIETRMSNSLHDNTKPNTSPSSNFSSASSTSSTSSLKQNQTQVKQSFSEDFTKMSASSQLSILQKQLKQSSGSEQNLTKEKKQRERTTFDPHEEISRLMQIFEQTHHPSRYQIASICDSLNSLACRKDKKPLEPYNIQYWFKNARAALRRKSKGDNPGLGKNASNELGSNEDSKNSFDDFEEENQLENSDFFQTQGVKHEKDEAKINYDYQEDAASINGYDNQSQTSNNLHKTVSTNSMPPAKNNGSRRNRVFIDPISEVPILEHYFSIETYPDHFLIEKICDILNKGEYRYKFPKLEARNIQLWFKNHRAKLKRLKTATSEPNISQQNSQNDKLNNSINNRSKLFERDEADNGEGYDEYDYGDYENEDNGHNSQAIAN